jgi:molecular chaperone DnaK
MSDIVGIDLGTTNSLIGIMDAGFPILLAHENGERLTPSVVNISETGEMLVGQPASRMRAIAPGSTIYSVKRLIGSRGGEEEDVDLAYEVVRKKGKPIRVRAGTRDYSPEEIS